MIYSVLRRGWLTLIVLAGCFSPHFDDNKISCGPNDECPPGLTCVQGVCRTPGTTGDTTPPATPMLTSVMPMSPANNNMPIVVGTAEADSTVKLYTDSGCTAQIATGTAAQLGNPGITVNVTDDSTTQFYATAADMFGNTSPCSLPVSYVEDSTAPPTPTLTDTLPPSPSRSLMPKVRGTAEPNAKVTMFQTADCSGTALGMGTADGTGAFQVDITVTPASTTQISAIAKDAAGNASGCSGSALTYIHNANALSAPTITSSNPASPSKASTNPTLSGVAEATIMVRIYTDALCSSALAGSTTSDSSGNFSVAVNVAQNSTTTFYAQAFDSAVGQYSACSSAGLTYVNDTIAPNPPSVTGSTPGSPSNSTMPTITGTAEVGSTVALYTDAACTVAVMNGTGPATAGSFAIQVAASGTTTYYGKATDAAGNTSACSATGYNFIYDAAAPSAPTLTGTAPTSPSQTNNTPIVIGTAENGSTVRVYRTSDCTGAEAGNGLATPGFGISITVPSNSSTPLSATATDVAGNTSACSSPALTYVHDNIAPAAPMLMTTNPTSPANMNMPVVSGVSEQGASVRLYTDAGCTTGIGSAAIAGSGGAFNITISVTDNTSTTVYAQATDGAGNISQCSAGLAYTEDSAGPGQPTLNSLPPSNSNTMPTLTGTAEPSTTVYIYASGTCGGMAVAMGTATGAGTYAIGVTVTANTSTQFTAKAVDAANNASVCSSAITYVHDNMAPGRPTALASNPISPAGSTAPAITGMAEANSTVYLYTNPTCSSSVAGTATATAGGTFSIPVTVGAGSTTTFYATATDAANNTSLCSTASVTYIQDNIPPGPPTNIASTPGSPANNAMPSITGNAEANSTVKLYTAAGCGAASFKAMGTTNGAGMFSIPVSVTANTTTTFYATATDGAGNTSTCTTSGYSYVEDATPPATPSGLTTTPPSPANFNSPIIHGTTEAGAAVVAYKDSGCTMMAGSATAAANGTFDITVSVMDNTTTTFYMRATDAAMNSTTCNAAGSTIQYIEDSTAVSPPTLTSTTPTSPSNSSTTPVVNGMSGNNYTIRLYTDAACAGPQLASGTANGTGMFSISGFSVTANTTTTFYATANNGVNTSACSSGLAYTHDNVVPTTPSGLSMSPTGPANNNTPIVRGSAESGTTIKVYTNSTCTSAIAGMGPSIGSFNVMVNAGVITDNTTTTFYVTATDAAGNVSLCSAGVSYIEDSAAPNIPTISSTSPASPANANNPFVNGTAEAGSTVALYTMAGCAGPSIASGTAGVGGSFSIQISVGDNSTTPLYAKAIDAASNASNCTSSPFNYIEDSAPPGVPGLTMVVPAGPANQNNPVVSGMTTEAGATIRLYGTAMCNGTVLGTATSTNGGAFSVTASVLDDTSTVFYANATDSAGNTSNCSTTSLSYVEDSTPPADPQGLSMNPTGPANNNNPVAAGSADPGTTIKLYADDKCLTGVVATTTVDASGKFSLIVPNGVILDDTTVSFSVTSTDAASNVSGCSSPVSYQEDSTALPPQLISVAPTSPSSTSTTPTISGSAEPSSTVTLYTNNTCTSAAVGSATTTSSGGFSISVSSVMPNTSTTYYGKIVDQAGNTSACSTTNVTFISDQLAPTFNGASSAVATATDKIFVQWPSATDTFTTAANMRYELCWGLQPRVCDSWVTKLTVTGVTNRTITGLNAGTRYYIQVRAVDQAGNVGAPSPTNTEVTDRTWGPGATTMITAGYNFACALQGDGTVQCWGAGGNGQLGNGGTSDSLVPVTVTGLVDAVAVSAGGSQSIGTSHVCALKADGTVWCWGYGGNGNLGNGNTASSTVPVQVMISTTPTAIPVTNAIAIASGGGHSCALIVDGTIRCWGRNSDGQIGDNSFTNRPLATLVGGGFTTYTSLDAGGYHTCATLADGTAKCWGQNTFGQLGNMSNTGSALPVGVMITGADRVKAIDVGDYHSCGLIYNGQVRCWGANTHGQLGNNTMTNSNVPVTVQASGGATLTNVSSIAMGGAFISSNPEGTSCAVLATGAMRCWGYNGFGELGNGNTTNQLQAVAVSGVTNAVRATVGADFTCGLSANGTVACAGDGGNGRLGNNSTTSSSTPVAVQNLFGVEGVTNMTGASYTECARFANGRARCWGYNGTGQVGNNTVVDQGYPDIPVLQGGNPLTGIVQVSTFYYHSCALIVDGTVRCWGYGFYGELGNSANTDSSQAVTVTGLTNAIQITTGFYHSCALISDGTIKCWGYNTVGQLGDNTTANANAPVSTMNITNAIGVYGAGNTTCAVLADGTARCWGWNTQGQLGDMTTTNHPLPVTVTGIANATSIGGGGYHNCALIAGGTAKCWGGGGSGQMGNGLTNATNSTPVMLTGSGLSHIAGGWYNGCATKADGHAYCWGLNSTNQVDASSTTPITNLTLYPGVASVARVTAGYHSIAQLADGTAEARGDGTYGGCGDGDTTGHTVATTTSVLYLP